ncbi:MAG: hypothetical protein CL623_01865 [Arcobacter sp.]|nr:hypothetical protein [Arcobacter sp.]|tara:strand:- start:18052 stop:18705 length:654 start_codon:yes stop_codon:yes gene_type:complete
MEQHRLQQAVEELKNMPTIDIKGKSYTQVSSRMAVFRKYFPDYSIVTNILHDDEIRVVVQTKITTPDGVIIATGLAEEFRGENLINTSSALENGETSSIGRALACLSLGGTEYASSFEVVNAVAQQNQTQNYNQNPRTSNQQNFQSQEKRTQYINQTQGNSLNLLTEQGITFMQQGSNTVAIGNNLYNQRDLLKSNGFKFDSSSKQWWKPSSNQQVA